MSRATIFKNFLQKRPAITLTVFAKEIKVGRRTLLDIQQGAEPRDSTWAKIQAGMAKYGFVP